MAGAALIVAGTMASCTPDMDGWGKDSSTDRLFGPTSISVTPTDSSASVSFGTIAGADKYQVQYLQKKSSSDTLSNDIDTCDGLLTIESTSSTVNIPNLLNDTHYFLRVRAVSEAGKPNSKWLYYQTSERRGTFKTEAEQIFDAVTSKDVSDNYVILRWNTAKTATHIIVKATDFNDTLVLTDEQKAAGTIKYENVEGSTTYTFTIYDGDMKRGTREVTTNAPVPSADYKYYWDFEKDGETINDDILDRLAEEAKARAASASDFSVSIAISADASVVYAVESALPEGMSINFFGLGGGERPKLIMKKTVNFAGTRTYINFGNVQLVNDGGGYLVNMSTGATALKKFTVKDCAASGFKANCFFRLQNQSNLKVDSLILTNSTFDDMCSGGYPFIYDQGKNANELANLKIDGCTFSNINAGAGTKSFIYFTKKDAKSIQILNSTFYNISLARLVDFDLSSDKTKPAAGTTDAFTISKCLFAKCNDDEKGYDAYRSTNAPSVTDCVITTDWTLQNTGGAECGKSSADIFTDAAKLDFTLKDGSLGKVGNPSCYFIEK